MLKRVLLLCGLKLIQLLFTSRLKQGVVHCHVFLSGGHFRALFEELAVPSPENVDLGVEQLGVELGMNF